ncbi:MAG TPA: bifunctional diaminohydroxyphosphoribosylaminopyrimidine deaminase/5-amino-6-(5-phosphoribosylamino)uracil reductase RibD [Hanamia sp.]|nr:bifunctional diaminohydroxyphosphoribosylaminopyrimidine deaminase/5-amino-6-(5-phosphoribosylamino)uracil reductase RibD [Hanamia sp.]
MSNEEKYMSRCIQLAKLGAGNVAPNPMVGAVLVYNDRIIGEGYHKKYGEAHAEVNCINNVPAEQKSLIEKSTMYVSLEPCSHFGKTPPCSNLIIQQKIKKVVIGCRDIYEEVDGRGIEKLRNAGLEVITGVLEDESRELNKRFFTFHQQKRPYIILKWAQSANGKIGSEHGERLFISNEYTNRIVHKWRSEEAGILVGANTALKDDPSLTTRLWKGKNPVRIVIDPHLKLPASLKIFTDESKTIIYNLIKNSSEKNIEYIQIRPDNLLESLVSSLYESDIQSILVEGGAKTLQSFIDQNLWDEARVITNGEMIIEEGVNAPAMKNFDLVQQETYFSDMISYFKRR